MGSKNTAGFSGVKSEVWIPEFHAKIGSFTATKGCLM